MLPSKHIDQAEITYQSHLNQPTSNNTVSDVIQHVKVLFKLNKEQDRAFSIVA